MLRVEDLLREELALETELGIARAQRSLLGFITWVKSDFRVNWHHRVICNLIDRMVAGEVRRVIVSAAPRHGKSEIISRNLPAYLLGRNPDESIIAVSYGADLAQRMNRDCQRIIDSDAYRQVFPLTTLSSANIRTVSQGSWLRNADMFEVVGRRGVYRAAGVGGAITGLGGSWLLVDDLLKNSEEAGSPTVLEKQWEWYQTTLRTRLAKDGRILLVMTRWSAGDIVGRLLDQARTVPEADQWHVLNLPAVAEGPPTPEDPRQPGEALWPEMFPLPELAKIRANGARAWQALYQGRPTPPGGAVLQESWWRFYRRPQLPPEFDQVIISADLTFADAKRGDWNVFQVWARAGATAYLLDQVRGKMDFTRQCAALVRLYEQHPEVRSLRIEAAANGAALVSALRSRIPGLTAVEPGSSSKQARVEAVMHHIEAGQVMLPDPKDAGWVDGFLVEASTFPHGRHDDQVDAMQIGLAGLFPRRTATCDAVPVSFGKASRWLGAS